MSRKSARSLAILSAAGLFVAGAALARGEPRHRSEPIRLGWPTALGVFHAYDAYLTQEAAPAQVALDEETWDDVVDHIGTDELPDDVRTLYATLVKRLHAMPLPESRRSRLRVCGAPESGLLTVEIAGAEPGPPPGPDASEDDRQEYTFRKLEAGVLQLWLKLSESGDIQSFYLPQAQKNIATLLFKLPAEIVREGDAWEIPTQLAQVGLGFAPEVEDYVSKARLLSLSRREDGTQEAELLYVVRHRVAGTVIESRVAEPAPFSFEARYLAAASFDVATASWRRYTGEIVLTSSGALESSSRQLLAVRPIAPGTDSGDGSIQRRCGEPTDPPRDAAEDDDGQADAP